MLEVLRHVVWGRCTLKLLGDFGHDGARAAMAKWLKAPVLET